MRKQYKNKRRSCGLCKPHKCGTDNRWKPKARSLEKDAAREIGQFRDYLIGTEP
jgi:hypothetical protein